MDGRGEGRPHGIMLVRRYQFCAVASFRLHDALQEEWGALAVSVWTVGANRPQNRRIILPYGVKRAVSKPGGHQNGPTQAVLFNRGS